MKLKYIIYYSISIFSVLSIILIFAQFYPLYSKTETRGYSALEIMSDYGINENRKSSKELLRTTDFGKKIQNISYLQSVLPYFNKHSSAYVLSEPPIQENMPYSETIDNMTVVTIPSIYSLDIDFATKYINELSLLIRESKGNLVLDLTQNMGGDELPMLLGVRSLLPEGKLLDEIDNKGEEYPLYLLQNKQIVGGIYNYKSLNLYPSLKSYKKAQNRKIAIIAGQKTASAAEILLLALKKSNIKIFGTPTAGYTSLNSNFLLESNKGKENWILSCTIGYFKITDKKSPNGERVFCNDKIYPDVTTETSIKLENSNKQYNSNLLNLLKHYFS